MVGETPWLPPLSWTGGGMTIRIYSVDDVEALREATIESYEHLKPWMPWARIEQTAIETEAIVRRLMSEYLSNTNFTSGIWEGDTLIGGTGFHPRVGPVEWKCCEIGMWIRAGKAGQGWGTRSLEQMLEWGFTQWGWERLIWKCDTRNIGSAKVAENCGMKLDATFTSDSLDVDGNRRDTHQFAILKDEWLQSQ